MEKSIDDSLRDMVRYLGEELGKVIKQHLGNEWLDKIETIRVQGRQSSLGDLDSTAALQQAFQSMSNDDLLTIGRAFSQFLNLANLAEQENTVASFLDEDPLSVFFDKLSLAEKTDMSLADAVSKLSIELVLTAHPTEVTRRTLIYKYAQLAQCLSELQEDSFRSGEREKIETRIVEIISQAWHTDEIRVIRPTPVDEAQWGFSVIESSLWQAVPDFIRKFDQQLGDQYDIRLPLNSNLVRFASWMGGDRDGNPFVTSKITEKVLLLAKQRATRLFKQDVHTLYIELSMNTGSAELIEKAGTDVEPYRALLGELEKKLTQTDEGIEAYLQGEHHQLNVGIHSQSQLIEPLELCYHSLHDAGLDNIANSLLLDTIRRAYCFGINLLKLDIRQDSERHANVFSELTRYFGIGDYNEWSEQDKQGFLLNELHSKRPLIPLNWQPSDEVQEVLNCCRVVAQQDKEALGIYIISMARAPSDVLAVHLLLRESGINWPMPVAPLFETLDDLNNAHSSMSRLLSIDWYRGYIKGQQYVMIGYSDSAKDAGALAAGWAQYQAQESLVNLALEHQISLTLFHGRGGTIGRGGLPAHGAILSQPPGSCLGGLRVTEQGETIRHKFGTEPLAQRSLALYASAILEALMLPPPAPKKQWREVVTTMANNARDNYRAIVRDDPNFVAYFRAATPELELSKLPLGSRPAKRKPNGGVESLRAIPWIFAWAQNRLVLPAWLGVMKAFQISLDEGQEQIIIEMKDNWPFFASRLSMLEMVFMKVNKHIAKKYDETLVDEELRYFGDLLRDELTQSQKLLLALLKQDNVMEKDLPAKASMEIRSDYLEPLHLIQMELLKRSRAQADDTVANTDLDNALMVSIAGLATGLRNTG